MKKWLVDHNQRIIRLSGSLLSLGLLVYFAVNQSWHEILQSIQQIQPLQLVFGALLLFFSRLFVVGRWYVLLRGVNVNISIRKTTVLTLAGLFASNFLPSTIGGDVVRMVGAMKLGCDSSICIASLAADRLVGVFGFLFTLPLGLVPLLKSGMVVAMPQSIVLSVWGERIKGYVIRIFQALSLWFKQPVTLCKALLLSWGNMLFLFLSIYVLVQGLGYNMPFWLVAGIWSLIYFVIIIPISINGYGLQELSTTYFFTTLGGLTVSQSLVLAVLIRITFFLASLPGALFLPEALSKISKYRTI